MIQNDAQLQRTREALIELESSMASLSLKKAAIHPDRFLLMAEPIVDHLRRLRAEIDEYIGVTAVSFAEAPLWLRLQGPGIELEDAPTSILTAMIDILRVGVQAVAEFLHRGSVGARPTAALKQACDFRFAGLAPGSVQVGLRLPEFPNFAAGGDETQAQARQALQLYLQAAAWAGSQDDMARLEGEIPDSEQRRVVLNQVARLIPRPRGGLELVELSGRAVTGGSVQLRKEARARVRQAITSTVREHPYTVEGVLREIDLDNRTFIVRDLEGGSETRCALSPDADGLLEIAKAALDYRVAVVGIRQRDPTRRQAVPLQVREIDIVGKEGEEGPISPQWGQELTAT